MAGKRILLLTLALIAIMTMTAFSQESASVEQIIIDAEKITIGLGETYSLNVKTVPPEDVETLEYSSAKPRVVQVDADGNVTGLKKGTSKVTITAPNGISATVKVKVANAPSKVKLALDKKSPAWGRQ